jgi:ABC-type oligopeptide transport system ATPase subunit
MSLSGADQESRRATELLIKLNREDRLAVFFSSHDLEMVRTLRTRSCAWTRANMVGGRRSFVFIDANFS